MKTEEDKLSAGKSRLPLQDSASVRRASAKAVVETAVMSAMLVAGKLALSFIPNVEVVTTLVIVFGVTFGFKAVAATLIFCTADMFLYAFSIDVAIAYFVYWDALAAAAAIMSRAGIKAGYAYLILALVGTLSFGVLTSLTYSLIYSVPFAPVYVFGLPFYAAQLLSSLVFMSVGFAPLCRVLRRIR